MKAILVLAPIVSLLLVGLVIALKSGEVAQGAVGGLRVYAENLSGLFVRLAGYGALLVAVQYAIGYPMTLGLSW